MPYDNAVCFDIFGKHILFYIKETIIAIFLEFLELPRWNHSWASPATKLPDFISTCIAAAANSPVVKSVLDLGNDKSKIICCLGKPMITF